MSISVTPIKIRPHLIPFFYKEFAGVEAKYLNKKVKACKIIMDSSLGRFIRLSVSKVYLPIKTTKLHLYISLDDQDGRKIYNSSMYKCISGKHSFLSVPIGSQIAVNDILEDQFRIAFVYYIQGAMKFNNMLKDPAIIDFMLKYELDDYGYNLDQMRKYYNRAVKKKHLMRRLQIKPRKTVLNYKTAMS